MWRYVGDLPVIDVPWRAVRAGCATALGLMAIAGSGPAASQTGQYERPPTFTASQVLPPELLHSPNYTIAERVPVENFQYIYQVQTKWGPFVIKGSDLLRVRVREIAATLKMEEIDSTSTLVGSAGKTAMRPVQTAKDLVTAPGQTIGDTFKGVGHIFGTVNAATTATDPHKEGVVASLTGGSTARRKLAYDFGVDTNTSFPPLDAELTRIATASAFGETSANVGLAFVTGGAGIAISVGGTSNTLRAALRDKTAGELEQEGRKYLATMGVSEATTTAFYATPHLSPTDKAIIVGELVSLGNAGDRDMFVAGAAKAPSVEMGFFYRRQAELIGDYNKRIAPVHRFVRLGGAPMIETDKGVVSLLPVDDLIWTAPIAELAVNANAERGGAGPAGVWITGKASPMASANLEKLGWKVVPKAGAQLGQ
jgi:hypothetical protein